MSDQVRPAPRLPHLEALRGIAALLVVVHHAWLECPVVGDLRPALAWLNQGHFLVTFFLILSGYCLTLPTLTDGRLRGGLLDFFGRRARRLLPAYYAAVALSLALIATVIGRPTGRHWDFALPVGAGTIASHLLLVHNFWASSILKINHVFWSIAVEWQVYFAFPILLVLARRLGIWWTSAITLGVGYLGSAMVVGGDHFGLMPHYYGMFALGMLAATVAHAPGRSDLVAEVSWGTIAALSLLATLCLGSTQSYEALDLPFGVACASSLVALSRPGRIPAALSCRPLAALGGLSYSLYLIHAPIQHLIVVTAFPAMGIAGNREFPTLLLAGTPGILLVAHAFSMAFERPFLAGSKARLAPPPERTSTIPGRPRLFTLPGAGRDAERDQLRRGG